LKPTFAPDVINIMLLGPGENVDTNANITKGHHWYKSIFSPAIVIKWWKNCNWMRTQFCAYICVYCNL